MSTFTVELSSEGADGIRVAVKDLIDMEGWPTTAGCLALARQAKAATADAACLAGTRAAGAWIVGRTNLHELALGATGINPWFGTPINPLDPRLVPGGSSSGSAVAVATGQADIAFGSDTGGSIRIPAACCGVAGLKTTWGRVPLTGVWPLAPSLDTIGPIAKDVAGLISGMQLLEPGFQPQQQPAPVVVGRLRLGEHSVIAEAIDRALAASGLKTVEVSLPTWSDAVTAGRTLLAAEAWQINRHLVKTDPDGIGADVTARLLAGRAVDEPVLARVRYQAANWRTVLDNAFNGVTFIAIPTLAAFPPDIENGEELRGTACTMPANLAGLPALALPVPSAGRLPASLQLIAPHGGEEALLAAGLTIEAAVLSA